MGAYLGPAYCWSTEALNVFLIMSQRHCLITGGAARALNKGRRKEAMINVCDDEGKEEEAVEAAAASATDNNWKAQEQKRNDDNDNEDSTWGRQEDSRVCILYVRECVCVVGY